MSSPCCSIPQSDSPASSAAHRGARTTRARPLGDLNPTASHSGLQGADFHSGAQLGSPTNPDLTVPHPAANPNRLVNPVAIPNSVIGATKSQNSKTAPTARTLPLAPPDLRTD